MDDKNVFNTKSSLLSNNVFYASVSFGSEMFKKKDADQSKGLTIELLCFFCLSSQRYFFLECECVQKLFVETSSQR